VPQITDMVIANVCRLVVGLKDGLHTENRSYETKRKKSNETSVKMRMFWPCVTVVRASRTVEALNSCEEKIH
jgi:hypothetical protein